MLFGAIIYVLQLITEEEWVAVKQTNNNKSNRELAPLDVVLKLKWTCSAAAGGVIYKGHHLLISKWWSPLGV